MAEANIYQQKQNIVSSPGAGRGLTKSQVEEALARARMDWRSFGVWYEGVVSAVQSPGGPEALLVETAWLFAYDFKLQALVAAWLRKNSREVDEGALVRALSNGDVGGLGTAYTYAVASFLKWKCGLSQWRKWRSVERAAKRSLRRLGRVDGVASWRLAEVKTLFERLALRRERRLRPVGLDMPAICIEEERKIFPVIGHRSPEVQVHVPRS